MLSLFSWSKTYLFVVLKLGRASKQVVDYGFEAQDLLYFEIVKL
jgi:hypothetical protein